MNKKWFLISSLLSLFLIQLASASLTLTEPSTVYSIGDEMNVNATIQSLNAENGFFTAGLVCDGRDIELVRIPYSAKPGQTNTFTISATLDRALIGSLQGDCFVKASYNDEDATTRAFEISSNVIVTVDVQGNMFAPKDDVSISGTAFLVNGQTVNGFVTYEIANTNISEEGTVTDGKFSHSITLPNTIASGIYNLKIIVSQRDEYGNALNSGSTVEQIKIKQVVQAGEIALSNITVQPGNELSYQLVLYDQVLAKATQDATVRLISPSGNIIAEKLVSSAAAYNAFTIGRDYAPGIWTVQAQTGEITANKTFGVTELKNVTVIMENATVVVRNTGNVQYTDPLEILIGDTTERVELNLAVGEERRMKIFAPNGQYSITAKSGENIAELGSAFLTGNVIKVSDLSDIQAAKIKMWLWIILIVIVAFFAYRAYRKFSRNRVFTSPSTVAPMPKASKKDSKASNDSFFWKSSSSAAPVAAAKTLSGMQRANTLAMNEDYGKKDDVSVLVLKIKNNDELTKYKGSEPAMNTIVQATGLARSAKAQISRDGNFTVMTFSKASTGSSNPHLEAAKVGKEMEDLFKSHNRKYARKVSFGIGLITGEMIVEKQGSSIQHTSTGAIVVTAKKIASHAHDSLLLHDSTHSKLRGMIKAEKGIGGMYWGIQSFVSREGHNEFIKKFMERRADESKSF